MSMNISLENPYGSVTIPRAQLRTGDDNSTVIINPMALDGTSSNPYDAYGAEGKNGGQNPPPYGGGAANGTGAGSEGGYTIKEDEEQVGRCYACCRRCRRK
ncbi:uncharacterized protein si:ch211-202f5.3 [Engraulis encrasicolus]|uniref:uncharacterized protein si:ch211-202f5.3 n=1 Tax=Engraulis encrasicolus TaxID=184585 RepID=UPI002FCEFF7C